ncbi:MAG: LysR family transcriptional regulator [Gluconacetobacter diazotrophicus]|nr:LysR family transcriptional regulator [Gluconacetobacter diazotrophicus]
MELRHIRYFLALAAEGNFTRAAAGVGIAQSPFSSQIRDLEREVGALLFRRVPHGAELTAAGRAFADVVRAMPALAERAGDAARRAARGETGALAVGFTASAAFDAVVPNAIRTFRRDYPEVSLRLEEANTTRLVAGLRDNTLDAAFLRPGSPDTGDLRLRIVSTDVLLLALPAAHPAAVRAEVALADLAGDGLVLFPRQAGPVLHDTILGAFRAAGVEPRVVQTAPQIASTINLVAAAIGITLVPASMARIAVDGVAYREVAGNPPETHLALATRRGDRDPIARNFVSCAIGRSGEP